MFLLTFLFILQKSSNDLVVREVAREVKTFERHSLLCTFDDGSEEGSDDGIHGSYLERTILVFDVLDEVDLIKFAFCFQEHWDDSIYENRRTVYIDCIDSVKVPGLPSEVAKHGPTFYELILGIVEWARSCGFLQYHLWACPNLEDQDYLFYRKPKEQKKPDEEMLVKHYWKINQEALKRRIVSEFPETYARHYFHRGKLVEDIPLYKGGIVESMLDVCEGAAMDKKEVMDNLGRFLEEGVDGLEEDSGCALASSLMVGSLNVPGPDSNREPVARLEEPEPLFSDLFESWSRFCLNQYPMHSDWGFRKYDEAKLTSQGIISQLHRDLEQEKDRLLKKAT